MLISCKIDSEFNFFKKSGRETGLFFKNVHYVYGYNNKKEMFYEIIIEDSMIRQAEKDRKE